MIRLTAGFLLPLLLASATMGFGAERPVNFPTIRTLEELVGQPLIKLDGGWQVQLGVGDGGKAAGPWRLVYCLAKHADADREWRVMRHDGESFGKRLGPVFFQVTAQSHRTAPQHAGRIAELFRLPREGLYCALIPTAWKGDYHVTVRSLGGAVIGIARFDVKQPAVCYWQPFAERRPDEASSVHYRVVSRAHAALPKFEELFAIWRPSANVKLAAPRGGTPLPGKIPVEAPWSDVMRQRAIALKEGQTPPPLLRLAPRGDTFDIESDVPMVAWPDLHLLARWWVNGKPVIPARTDRIEAISIGRALRYTKLLKVAFGLPENLGPLEAGDLVGVQVLYSPALVKTLPKSRVEERLRLASLSDRSVRATVPLLSNRIEIAVTPGMLNSGSQGGRAQ